MSDQSRECIEYGICGNQYSSYVSKATHKSVNTGSMVGILVAIVAVVVVVITVPLVMKRKNDMKAKQQYASYRSQRSYGGRPMF